MRKLLAALAVALVAFTSCGGGGEGAAASPTPTGTHEITGRIMGPADKARDTVDQLNDRTGQLEDSYP